MYLICYVSFIQVRGRIGDSPITGSGCYVDTTVGGCAATGDGDIMMRFLPSYAGVTAMRHLSPTQAAIDAIQPIIRYYPNFSGGIVCLSANGDYGAASYNMDFHMSVMEDGMTSVLVVPVEDLKK
jgi:N4-(beta-N-acetylglucosaminyl)-L-asparaginase